MFIIRYLRGPGTEAAAPQSASSPPESVNKTKLVAAASFASAGSGAVAMMALPVVIKAKVVEVVTAKLGVMAFSGVVRVVSEGVAWYVVPQMIGQYGLTVLVASSTIGGALTVGVILSVHQLRQRCLEAKQVADPIPLEEPPKVLEIDGAEWVLLPANA